jgi:pimeloyl-ACP methyl ester carboxylesterase
MRRRQATRRTHKPALLALALALALAAALSGAAAGCERAAHLLGLNMDRTMDEILDSPDFDGRLFFSRRDRTRTPPGAIDYDIPVAPGVTLGARWHITDLRKPSVLAFHGNGETVSDYDSIAQAYANIGLNLFMTDYRGYGWSGGAPTLRGYRDDPAHVAEFFLAELARESAKRNVRAPEPLLFGRSLGSGPAVSLALSHPDRFCGLVLESGFSDLRPVLALFRIDAGAQNLSLHQQFSNNVKLKNNTLPALILHGARDDLLPPENARENFAAIPHEEKELLMIPDAGHNNLLARADIYFDAINRFVRTRCQGD